jgi:hypothetical protein
MWDKVHHFAGLTSLNVNRKCLSIQLVSSLGTKDMHLCYDSIHYASQDPNSATTEIDMLLECGFQKMAADEVLRRYAAGERDFRGVNLRDEILTWADLSGADLSGADLSGANLNWANLSRVNLTAADLSRADLAWANLKAANLSGADLSNAHFSGADLSGANWSGAIMPDGSILPEDNSSLASKFLSWLFMER